MKPTTLAIMKSALASDDTVTPEQAETLLKNSTIPSHEENRAILRQAPRN